MISSFRHPSPRHPPNDARARRIEATIALLSIALALPFLDQAFHVDDPNFLALADHVRARHPLALYDFTINWGGTDERAFDILANPPLVPWYLAMIGHVARAREWVYHLAFLPFLLAALEGARRLGRRFLPSSHGGWRAMLFVYASPAFLISSHTVMPDLPLLATYGLGLALAIEGLDEKRRGHALLGGTLAGCSALCRYSGMTVLPLLLLYAILHRVRWTDVLVVMAAALVPLSLWSVGSSMTYDQIHWLAMTGFEGRTLDPSALLHKALYQVSALGLAVAPAACLNHLASVRRPPIIFGLTAMLVVGSTLLCAFDGAPPWVAIPTVVGMMGGGWMLMTAIGTLSALKHASLWRRMGGRHADTLFLGAWVLGMFVFNEWLLFASVRYLLPALIPVVFLILRLRAKSASPGWFEGVAALAGLALGLHLSWADRAFAEGYRTYVRALPPIQGERYFVGHWGLQYYMEQAGGHALSAEAAILPKPGDEIIVPTYAWPQDRPAGLNTVPVDKVDMPGTFGLRTFTVYGRGCFYADILAPGPTPVLLPFGFDFGPAETLTRWKVIP